MLKWFRRARPSEAGTDARPGPAGLDDARWQRLLQAYPFARAVGEARLPTLRARCDAFLATKRFAGAAGFEVDDDIGAAIALQACVPVVELGLQWYDDFEQLVVYPEDFVVSRTGIDEAGVVHEETVPLAGEAMDRGPVVLSWAAAHPDAVAEGWNVVIHEFVHKLDLRDGEADGIPPLPAARAQRWEREIEAAWRDFRRQLDKVERAIPRWVDPESEAADRYYARLPLDAYAATDRGEFFAVAGETFFLAPGVLEVHWPALYGLMVEFFGLEPEAVDWAGLGDPDDR